MPKAKVSSESVQCNGCLKYFKNGRSLGVHQYHCRINVGGYGTSAANNSRLAYFSSAPGRGIANYTSTSHSSIIATTTSHHHYLEEEAYFDNSDPINNNDEGLTDGTVGGVNQPFLLSPSELKDIPGEIQVVTHLSEQRVHVELLHLLEKAEAPDYLFKDIIDWASRAKSHNYSFSPNVSSRPAVLKDLQSHFNMQGLRPRISELKLEAVAKKVPMVYFDFQQQLISLLTDTSLMQPENLVINKALTLPDGKLDVSPWFEPYQSPSGLVDEILSGRWYHDTVANTNALGNNVFVCPLVFYVDKTFIDPMRSRFNLEPLNFTLAIFNRSCRSRFNFWRTLGYIPETPPSDEKNPPQGNKARNYHQMLRVLFNDLAAIHHHPMTLDNFHLRIGNYVKLVNLRIPIAFIIADTQGADKLCGRYLVYTDGVKRLHRTCTCPPESATDTDYRCTWVTMEEMMNVIDRGDKEELAKYSQQHIPDHAFRDLDFGANSNGIYGATPNDTLHGIKLGIMSYILEVFLEQDLNGPSRHYLDKALRELLPYMKQGGAHNFPRMYFPNGITSLSNTTAEECVGILFVTYLICITTHGRNALRQSDKISIARINLYVQVFEKLLIFYAWLSNPNGFWSLTDARSKTRWSSRIKKLVEFICLNFERKSNQGWNISKMHELLHLTRLIDIFGSPLNFDSGPCERMHKDVAKKPGRKSQKRHATFTLQAANRLADRHVIDLAHSRFSSSVSTENLDTSTTFSPYVLAGSTFVLDVSTDPADNTRQTCFQVSIRGMRGLASKALDQLLYPGLVEFIVAHFSTYEGFEMPNTIRCCSEFHDQESGYLFRAHHDYRATGFWHDWVLASYKDDETEEGFSNVPAKLLCFLPDGVPGDHGNCYAVCHPCGWASHSVSQLVTKWTLVPCAQSSINGIPYDVIPVSSLFAHCLVLPDLDEPGVVYQVADKNMWHRKKF